MSLCRTIGWSLLVSILVSGCVIETGVGFSITPGTGNIREMLSRVLQIIQSLGGAEQHIKSMEGRPQNETYFVIPDEHSKNEVLYPGLWLIVDDQSNEISLRFFQFSRPFTPYAKDKLRTLYRSLSTSFSNDHMCIRYGIKQLRKLDIEDLPPECTKGQSRS